MKVRQDMVSKKKPFVYVPKVRVSVVRGKILDLFLIVILIGRIK